MTVIAFDGKYLVADRQCTSNEIASRVNKIHLVPNGVAAIYGDAEHGMAIIRWLSMQLSPDEYPVCGTDYANVVLITPKKQILTFGNRYAQPLQYLDKYFTAGSGGDIALGALHSGKSALEAVKITSKLSIGCGMGYSVADVKTMLIKHYV